MGNGSFDGNRFELFATFGYNASTSDFSQWENSFRAASKALFDATDGQMSIGKVTIANNKAGADKADMILTAPNPLRKKSGTVGTIKPNAPSSHSLLRDDERANSGVIVHEFGHYLFGLEDEYRDTVGNVGVKGKCTDDATGEHACIMEFSGLGVVIDPTSGLPTRLGDVSEFCCAANHTSQNNQQRACGESCWETIVRNWGLNGRWGNFPQIKGPSSGNRPQGAPPAVAPVPLQWNVAPPWTKYLFALSDAGNQQLSYTDFFKHIVEPITFLESHIEMKFLVPPARDLEFSNAIAASFPEWKAAREYNRQPFSLKNLNRELDSKGGSNQQLILHGMPTAALRNALTEAPDQLESKILTAGFFAHSIAQTSGVQELSLSTNGFNRILFQTNDERGRVYNVCQYLSTAFETLEEWEIASSSTHIFPNSLNNETSTASRYSKEDLQRVKNQPIDPKLYANKFDLPVFIEEDATQVAFLLCLPANSRTWLYLQRPNGEIVDPKDITVTFLDKTEYKLLVVSQSDGTTLSGQWFVRIERTVGTHPTPFKIVTFVKNDKLRTYLTLKPTAQVSEYKLSVSINYDWLPVCNMSTVNAQLIEYLDSGDQISSRLIELEQAGLAGDFATSPADGVYSATIQHNSQKTLAIRVTLANVGSAITFEPELFDEFDDLDSPQVTKDPALVTPNSIPAFNRVLEAYIGHKEAANQ